MGKPNQQTSNSNHTEQQIEWINYQKEKIRAEQENAAKIAIAREEEKTKRNIAKQEAKRQKQITTQQIMQNHQKELADIRQKRADNPIKVICPRCTAPRNVNKKSGLLICPYCDYKEPLPDYHKYIPEIDEIGSTDYSPLYGKTKKKSKINPWAILSLALGCISAITCGLFFIPEILGLVFGGIPYLEKNKNLSVADKVFLITGIVLNSIFLLISIIIIIIAILNPSTKGTNDSTNNVSPTVQTSISTEHTTVYAT